MTSKKERLGTEIQKISFHIATALLALNKLLKRHFLNNSLTIPENPVGSPEKPSEKLPVSTENGSGDSPYKKKTKIRSKYWAKEAIFLGLSSKERFRMERAERENKKYKESKGIKSKIMKRKMLLASHSITA